ncbi:MAG: aminotransferase class V-fold PLP-dependent enzyme [Candidatus Omnitrophota bacterium]|nr:aminotransferase class V-fold PLP-dependent enzyme [Candidatus Omnitrophota bacterium]
MTAKFKRVVSTVLLITFLLTDLRIASAFDDLLRLNSSTLAPTLRLKPISQTAKDSLSGDFRANFAEYTAYKSLDKLMSQAAQLNLSEEGLKTKIKVGLSDLNLKGFTYYKRGGSFYLQFENGGKNTTLRYFRDAGDLKRVTREVVLKGEARVQDPRLVETIRRSASGMGRDNALPHMGITFKNMVEVIEAADAETAQLLKEYLSAYFGETPWTDIDVGSFLTEETLSGAAPRSQQANLKEKIHQIVVDRFIKEAHQEGRARNISDAEEYRQQFEEAAKFLDEFSSAIAKLPGDKFGVMLRNLAADKGGNTPNGKACLITKPDGLDIPFTGHSSRNYGINIVERPGLDMAALLVHEFFAWLGEKPEWFRMGHSFGDDMMALFTKWREAEKVKAGEAGEEGIIDEYQEFLYRLVNRFALFQRSFTAEDTLLQLVATGDDKEAKSAYSEKMIKAIVWMTEFYAVSDAKSDINRSFFIDITYQPFLSYLQIHDWKNRLEPLVSCWRQYTEAPPDKKQFAFDEIVNFVFSDVNYCSEIIDNYKIFKGHLQKMIAAIDYGVAHGNSVYLIQKTKNDKPEDLRAMLEELANQTGIVIMILEGKLKDLKEGKEIKFNEWGTGVLDKFLAIFHTANAGIEATAPSDYTSPWKKLTGSFLYQDQSNIDTNISFLYKIFLRMLFPDIDNENLSSAVEELTANESITRILLDFTDMLQKAREGALEDRDVQAMQGLRRDLLQSLKIPLSVQFLYDQIIFIDAMMKNSKGLPFSDLIRGELKRMEAERPDIVRKLLMAENAALPSLSTQKAAPSVIMETPPERDLASTALQAPPLAKRSTIDIPESTQTPVKVFDALEKGVYTALERYSNVHRGLGVNAKVSDMLLDVARHIILSHFKADEDHVVIFGNKRSLSLLKRKLSKEHESYEIYSDDIGLPIGVGALVVDEYDLPYDPPPYVGGGTVTNVSGDNVQWAEAPEAFEAGTPNIMGIIAFARAMKMIEYTGDPDLFKSKPSRSTIKEIFYNDPFSNYAGEELLAKLKTSIIGQGLAVPAEIGELPYVNFDNGASTPALSPVWDTARKVMSQPKRGQKRILDESKKICRSFFNAPDEDYEIIFTSNTTESVNIAAQFIRDMHKGDPRLSNTIINTFIEHNSNELPWRFSLPDWNHIRLPADDEGFIDMKLLEEGLSKSGGAKIVAISGASNVLGSINNIKAISRIAHRYGAKVLVDAAQLAGHHKIDMKSLGIDYLAFSGHKMYAPFGAGGLIVRKDALDVDKKKLNGIKRSGERNVAGIAAMAKSMELLNRVGMDLVAEDERKLTAYALDKLASVRNVKMFGVQDPALPKFSKKSGVISFIIKTLSQDFAAKIMSESAGIGIRSGCFCAHMLVRSLFYSQAIYDLTIGRKSFIRISFGIGNTIEEVDRFISALSDIARKGIRHLAVEFAGWQSGLKTPTEKTIDAFAAGIAQDVYSPIGDYGAKKERNVANPILDITHEEVERVIDEINPKKWWRNVFNDKTKTAMIEKLSGMKLERGRSVLVVGPGGNDYLPVVLTKLGLKTYIIDTDLSQIKRQRLLYEKFGVAGQIGSYVSYEQLEDVSFDYIMAFGVINGPVDQYNDYLFQLAASSGLPGEMAKELRSSRYDHMLSSVAKILRPAVARLKKYGGRIFINAPSSKGDTFYPDMLSIILPKLSGESGKELEKIESIDVSDFTMNLDFLKDLSLGRAGMVYDAKPSAVRHSASGKITIPRVDVTEVIDLLKNIRIKEEASVLEAFERAEIDQDKASISEVTLNGNRYSVYVDTPFPRILTDINCWLPTSLNNVFDKNIELKFGSGITIPVDLIKTPDLRRFLTHIDSVMSVAKNKMYGKKGWMYLVMNESVVEIFVDHGVESMVLRKKGIDENYKGRLVIAWGDIVGSKESGVGNRARSSASGQQEYSSHVSIKSLLEGIVKSYPGWYVYWYPEQVTVKVEDGVDVRLDGSRIGIYEILNKIVIEMLHNAGRACRDKSRYTRGTEYEPRAEIGAKVTDDNGQKYLCLYFKDNGDGIPDENKKRIFEHYFTTRGDGTGLGLPNLKSLIEDNGGTISVESELDKGTTFTIRLPITDKPAVHGPQSVGSTNSQTRNLASAEDGVYIDATRIHLPSCIVDLLKGREQPRAHEGLDPLQHTQNVRSLLDLSDLSPRQQLRIVAAAEFHDVGKIVTCRKGVEPPDKARAILEKAGCSEPAIQDALKVLGSGREGDHTKVSGILAPSILKEIGFKDEQDIKIITFLIGTHDAFGGLTQAILKIVKNKSNISEDNFKKEISDAIEKTLKELTPEKNIGIPLNEILELHYRLARADIASIPWLQLSAENIDFVYDIVKKSINNHDSLDKLLKGVTLRPAFKYLDEIKCETPKVAITPSSQAIVQAFGADTAQSLPADSELPSRILIKGSMTQGKDYYSAFNMDTGTFEGDSEWSKWAKTILAKGSVVETMTQSHDIKGPDGIYKVSVDTQQKVMVRDERTGEAIDVGEACGIELPFKDPSYASFRRAGFFIYVCDTGNNRIARILYENVLTGPTDVRSSASGKVDFNDTKILRAVYSAATDNPLLIMEGLDQDSSEALIDKMAAVVELSGKKIEVYDFRELASLRNRVILSHIFKKSEYGQTDKPADFIIVNHVSSQNGSISDEDMWHILASAKTSAGELMAHNFVQHFIVISENEDDITRAYGRGELDFKYASFGEDDKALNVGRYTSVMQRRLKSDLDRAVLPEPSVMPRRANWTAPVNARVREAIDRILTSDEIDALVDIREKYDVFDLLVEQDLMNLLSNHIITFLPKLRLEIILLMHPGKNNIDVQYLSSACGLLSGATDVEFYRDIAEALEFGASYSELADKASNEEKALFARNYLKKIRNAEKAKITLLTENVERKDADKAAVAARSREIAANFKNLSDEPFARATSILPKNAIELVDEICREFRVDSDGLTAENIVKIEREIISRIDKDKLDQVLFARLLSEDFITNIILGRGMAATLNGNKEDRNMAVKLLDNCSGYDESGHAYLSLRLALRVYAMAMDLAEKGLPKSQAMKNVKDITSKIYSYINDLIDKYFEISDEIGRGENEFSFGYSISEIDYDLEPEHLDDRKALTEELGRMIKRANDELKEPASKEGWADKLKSRLEYLTRLRDFINEDEPVRRSASGTSDKVQQAATLADTIKLRASEEKHGIIIGIETSGWVPNEQKAQIQPLAKAVNDLVEKLQQRGIMVNVKVALGNNPKALLESIKAKQDELKDPTPHIAILGSEKTLTSEEFSELKDAFMAYVDMKNLENTDYIQLLEMLNVMLNISFGRDIPNSVDMFIDIVGANVIRLRPIKRIDKNEPSRIYKLQIAELARQA